MSETTTCHFCDAGGTKKFKHVPCTSYAFHLIKYILINKNQIYKSEADFNQEFWDQNLDNHKDGRPGEDLFGVFYVTISKRAMYNLNICDAGVAPDKLTTLRISDDLLSDISKLLNEKLKTVKEKSYDCTKIHVEVAPFDVFLPQIKNIDVPVIITLEIHLHIPIPKGEADIASGIMGQGAIGAGESSDED